MLKDKFKERKKERKKEGIIKNKTTRRKNEPKKA